VVMKIGDTQITQTQFDQMYAAFLKDNEGGVAQKAGTVAANYAGSLMLSKQALAQTPRPRPGSSARAGAEPDPNPVKRRV
jgi:hypothetical protein